MKKKTAHKPKEGSKTEKKADKRQFNSLPKMAAKRIKGWDTARWENSSSDGIA